MAAQLNIPHPRKRKREMYMKWCLTTSMIIANETLDDDVSREAEKVLLWLLFGRLLEGFGDGSEDRLELEIRVNI
jgi:hypothetical protein